MKLSEAIRLGTMLHPQGTGSFYNPVSKRTCALGAALATVGALDYANPSSSDNNLALHLHFPLTTAHVTTPCSCTGTSPLEFVVWHLNDAHDWTREAIADWVATVEPAEQPAPEEARATNAVREVIDSPLVTLRV